MRPAAVGKDELRPPTYGGPQRDAINSVIDNVVQDITGKVNELRKVLDDIEQRVLESAANSKKTLTDHISICVRVNDEIVHMREVVTDLRDIVPE